MSVRFLLDDRQDLLIVFLVHAADDHFFIQSTERRRTTNARSYFRAVQPGRITCGGVNFYWAEVNTLADNERVLHGRLLLWEQETDALTVVDTSDRFTKQWGHGHCLDFIDEFNGLGFDRNGDD